MFLQKVRILAGKAAFQTNMRCLNIALGPSDSEFVEKWKKKFANENISEIESSIKHILNHVIEQNVRIITNFCNKHTTFSFL